MVIDYRVPVRCGGVLIKQGDIIFGDVDGVVSVPRDVLEPVVEQALAKVEGENHSREMLLQGHKLRDVYDRFGVL